jgi:hypothetical protein
MANSGHTPLGKRTYLAGAGAGAGSAGFSGAGAASGAGAGAGAGAASSLAGAGAGASSFLPQPTREKLAKNVRTRNNARNLFILFTSFLFDLSLSTHIS